MKKNVLRKISSFIIALGMGLGAYVPANAGIDVHYQYALADFSGPIETFQARLAVSRQTNEVFVFDPAQKNIRVFNEHGMEIFKLGEEDEFVWARDLAVDDEANIYILFPNLSRNGIAKYNFRGDLVGKIEMRDIPSQFADINPSIIVFSQDLLYLVEPDAIRIMVIDKEGTYQAGYEALPLVREIADTLKKGKDRKNMMFDMFGFNVDNHGNMLFTIPSLASVFRLSPGGGIEHFGKAGSSLGQFGVVAGIAVDEQGYMYLSDRLRCVVMVFDKDFNFVNEFGYRGYGPSNLIVPSDVAVSNGNIFVSQAANRGVSVFQAKTTLDAEGGLTKEQ